MALQSLGRPLFWPNLTLSATVARTLTPASTLDAAGEYVSYIYRATESMVVSHVWHRTSTTATGSPTVDIRIETVDATTGLPTGTLWATNTNIITGTLATNTEYTQALTAAATINAGDTFCIKFLYNSGTAIAPIGLVQGGSAASQFGLPYIVTNTGTPTKSALTSSIPTLALCSGATSAYRVNGTLPISTAATQTFSTANGDAFGNRFQLPFRCRCAGLSIVRQTTYGEFTYGIYSDAGAELSSSSTVFDNDMTANATGLTGLFYFDSPVILSAATWYRAALWPTSATNVTVYKWTTATNMAGGMPYSNFHYTTKATGGAWTDSATSEALVMDLIINQLDDGAAGLPPTIQSYPIIG